MLWGVLLMPAGWPSFEPVGDVVAVLTLSVAFVLACLDCHLRHDRRPLPMITTTAALTVLWAANLIAFSGVVPGVTGPSGMLAASWIFLIANLTGPILLASSLLHRAGNVNSCWVIASAMSAGIMVGVGMTAVAWLIASSPFGGAGDSLPVTAWVVGALELVPATLALLLVLRGSRGDGRVLWAVLMAFGFSSLAAFVLLLTPSRDTVLWNVAQLLGLLAGGALLAGMLGLYPMSVRAEQEDRQGLEGWVFRVHRRELLGGMADRPGSPV